MDRLKKEGPGRYEAEKPPGYEDRKKEGSEKYGDLAIWFEIIGYGARFNKDVIFISDDQKRDWWLRTSGKTFGPHPELIAEFAESTGHRFFAYTSEQFFKFAQSQGVRNLRDESAIETKQVKRKRTEKLKRGFGPLRLVTIVTGE